MRWTPHVWGAVVLLTGATLSASANEVIAPASQRFAQMGAEVPDFQRHVLPLMGRLGCNGRACHGSFQGRGGFRLSLFGYDFKTDHDAITTGDKPRFDPEKPLESLFIEKPMTVVPHEGGKKIEEGTWQHHVFASWLKAGAKLTAEKATFNHLEVTPRELVFNRPGERTPLRVLAHWSDGSVEDVTCISRFRSNDESIAEVDENGIVTCKGKGDTHIVAFYDNGVTPIPAMLPVSDKIGPNYPTVPTSTKVDELILTKLRKVGIVPSELCTDAEFLRRLSIDMTGTLPTPREIEAFLADSSPDKRSRKIDELLSRPSYSAWWTTKLCDMTGNNPNQLLEREQQQEQAQHWYDWIHERVANNTPYDQLVAGIVLATSRLPNESYDDYCNEMAAYYGKEHRADFHKRPTMPYFWTRQDARKPEDIALRVSHSFLGVRLQCAQCHKHPFDQWTQQDFNQFTAFFSRIAYGVKPADKKKSDEMTAALKLDTLKGNDARKEAQRLLNQGKVVPFREVFLQPVRNGLVRVQKSKGTPKNAKTSRVLTPKVLGGEEVQDSHYDDPREPLMEWMRDEDNPYFARAFVNRVWAGYFEVGIVEPADDQNLANPPSNVELLDYLSKGFVQSGFDMKWLHRQIANSDAYQRSWRTNDTNVLDSRNFSRAAIRRLPAEVVLDAVTQATARTEDLMAMATTKVAGRAIAQAGTGYTRGGRNGGNFALQAFGKAPRLTSCDCERSNEPSLLQAIYLRNDSDVFRQIDRPDGWIASLTKGATAPVVQNATRPAGKVMATPVADQKGNAKRNKVAGLTEPQIRARLADMEQRLAKARSAGRKEQVERLESQVARLRQELQAELKGSGKGIAGKPQVNTLPKIPAQPISNEQVDKVIREVYLRTVSRPPTSDELAKARTFTFESASRIGAVRDLLWAMLNTKEFVVNH